VNLTEYIILFVLAASTGAGVPGPGDASVMAAGTLAGEGRLNVGVVFATAMIGWLAGSAAGYEVGRRGGRRLLERPGWLEKKRLKLLAKGDHVFGRHNFAATVTMPAYVSGIFRVKFPVFLLGALVSGLFYVGLYVGLSYFLGAEIAERIGNAGAKAVLGVAVVVAAGLGIKAGLSRWRATRQTRESEMV
jgi:membrane protein DedA with SNARE-associated domain